MQTCISDNKSCIGMQNNEVLSCNPNLSTFFFVTAKAFGEISIPIPLAFGYFFNAANYLENVLNNKNFKIYLLESNKHPDPTPISTTISCLSVSGKFVSMAEITCTVKYQFINK